MKVPWAFHNDLNPILRLLFQCFPPTLQYTFLEYSLTLVISRRQTHSFKYPKTLSWNIRTHLEFLTDSDGLWRQILTVQDQGCLHSPWLTEFSSLKELSLFLGLNGSLSLTTHSSLQTFPRSHVCVKMLSVRAEYWICQHSTLLS